MSVTDSEPVHGAHSIPVTNPGVTGIEPVVAADSLSVTPKSPIPDEELAARRRAREAHRTGALCGKCGREFSVDELVIIGVAASGECYFRGFYLGYKRWYAPLCRECGPQKFDVRWWRKGPCASCGRTVVFNSLAGTFRRWVSCSERCSKRHQNARRYPAYTREKVCEACYQPFTATRRDAKTCSAACKQKAYRQRKKD